MLLFFHGKKQEKQESAESGDHNYVSGPDGDQWNRADSL